MSARHLSTLPTALRAYRCAVRQCARRTWSISTQPAMFAGRNYATRMPFSRHAMCMTTIASIIITGTGVLAPVSLFAPVLAVCTLLLVSIVVLSGLTGFVNLVGLTSELIPIAAQGD